MELAKLACSRQQQSICQLTLILGCWAGWLSTNWVRDYLPMIGAGLGGCGAAVEGDGGNSERDQSSVYTHRIAREGESFLKNL